MEVKQIRVLSYIDTFKNVDVCTLVEAMDFKEESHKLRKINSLLTELVSTRMVEKQIDNNGISYYSLTEKGRDALTNLKPMEIPMPLKTVFDNSSGIKKLKFSKEMRRLEKAFEKF